ncbi:extensin-like [Archocentrus centrarchus]|uniref:extensin-like n=1 Tax=Archocentrus centrarchus TaxID=63155 RepID=UPI0011EA2CB7|nr:extensin-like [Archocentrus centrarchus]
MATLQGDDREDDNQVRLQRLRELQLVIDSAKRPPYSHSVPACQTSYPPSYYRYPPQDTSLHRLTLDNPAGSYRSTPLHCPSRNTTAADEELPQQPVLPCSSPSRQPSLPPQTGESRAQDQAMLTPPILQASAQESMDDGWISNPNSAPHTPQRQDGYLPRSASQLIIPQAQPVQPVSHPPPPQPSNPSPPPVQHSLPPPTQYRSYPQYPVYPPAFYSSRVYYPYHPSLPPAGHMPMMPSLTPYGQPVPPPGPPPGLPAPGIL